MGDRRLLRLVLALLALGLAWGYARLKPTLTTATAPATEVVRSPADDDPAGERLVLDAFAARRSDVPVSGAGTVDKILPDDREGARHQRFILRLPGGHTILVSHNIDVAARVPLAEGDVVRYRGVYEWNERGGVVHWTHHDPHGSHEGGFLEHQGRRYE